MKHIFTIFKTDLRGLLKNVLALVVAVGLCLLPALYAWFNIYANWDPYANTGNIKIAVVNLDQGGEDTAHNSVNMGNNIVDSLKEKDSINWIFLDTEEEAVEGVEAGSYYAALVIDEEFTYGMYHGVAQNVASPKITYYVNDKKNAVATKITDSAVSSIQASINKEFIRVLTEQVFTETNEVSDDINAEDVVETFTSKLQTVSDSLGQYEAMIDEFTAANNNLSSATDDAGVEMSEAKNSIDEGAADLETAQDNLAATKKSFNEFSDGIDDSMDQIEQSLDNMKKAIEDANLSEDAEVLSGDLKDIASDTANLNQSILDLSSSLALANGVISSDQLQAISDALDQMSDMAGELSEALGDLDTGGLDKETVAALEEVMKKALEDYKAQVQAISDTYYNDVVPGVNATLDSMSETLTTIQNILTGLSSSAGTMSDIFSGVGGTLDTLNMSLSEIREVIDAAKGKVDDALDELNSADEEEKIQILLNLLGGDPETLGEFFAEPVQVESHYIYEISNYGSGVAPFYTTLAIWVGMTVLVSLIKVHAKKPEDGKYTNAQLFFGRYLLFLLLSQIQTLIIVLGDLYWLKIQCVHPFAFWGAAAMASLTFSILVYSLTIAFGDIGKAAAVVIMVIQIAGSGGTYPIEALPSFFKSVYIFFPFPYAINAMRECIGGMYKGDYWLYLLKLLIFCAAGLAIGLVVRVPFIRLNHYIEERMEDTEML